MNQIKLFIDLTRLRKPIGYMLLFWPCAWGLTLAYDFSSNLNNYFFYLLLFFLGSILMRSAGCIVNDIFDKEFDKKVFRTKNRPIASGKILIRVAIFYAAVLCLVALFVLLNFNKFSIHQKYFLLSRHREFNDMVIRLSHVVRYISAFCMLTLADLVLYALFNIEITEMPHLLITLLLRSRI